MGATVWGARKGQARLLFGLSGTTGKRPSASRSMAMIPCRGDAHFKPVTGEVQGVRTHDPRGADANARRRPPRRRRRSVAVNLAVKKRFFTTKLVQALVDGRTIRGLIATGRYIVNAVKWSMLRRVDTNEHSPPGVPPYSNKNGALRARPATVRRTLYQSAPGRSPGTGGG
jgi:hypothetical protein